MSTIKEPKTVKDLRAVLFDQSDKSPLIINVDGRCMEIESIGGAYDGALDETVFYIKTGQVR